MSVEPAASPSYLSVMLKYRRATGLMALAGAVIALVAGLVRPRFYEAVAQFLPPKPSPSFGGMEALASLAPGDILMGQLARGGSSTQLSLELLKSPAVLEAAVEKFDLVNIYGTETVEGARQALLDNCRLHGATGGIVTVTMKGRGETGRALCPEIANFLVDRVGMLFTEISTSAAGRERAFLEERLKLAKKELNDAEEALRSFKEDHKVVGLEASVSAAISMLAELRAQLAARQTQRSVLLTHAAPTSPELQRLEAEISAIKARIAELGRGEFAVPGVSEADGRDNIFVPLNEIPQLGLEHIRIYREFQTQQAIHEMLTRQYEMAKIAAARTRTTLQVIHRAKIPERPANLALRYVVLAGGMAGLILGILVGFVREEMRGMLGPQKENHVSPAES